MVCHALELFCLHHDLGAPSLTERLDSCEPLHFCDGCGPHRPSDQTKCLVLELVKGLLVGLCCGDHAVEPCWRWGLSVPWYTVLSIFSLAPQVVPASLRKIASLRLAFAPALTMSCFWVCLLSNVMPGYVASSSSFSGVPPRVMVPAFCFGDGVNKMAENLSLSTATHHFSVQMLSLSADNYILYVAVVAYSSLHQITKLSAYNAALVPLASSDSRSLMKSWNNLGHRTPHYGTPCLSRIFLL